MLAEGTKQLPFYSLPQLSDSIRFPDTAYTCIVTLSWKIGNHKYSPSLRINSLLYT